MIISSTMSSYPSPHPLRTNTTNMRFDSPVSASWGKAPPPTPASSLSLTLTTSPVTGPSSSRPSQSCPRPSEIIPRLYISDLSSAESRTTLSSLGITHVVTAMRGTVALPVPVAHLHIPLDDFPFAELVAHLPATTSFITDALTRNPASKVLVHCAEGVSRSVSVVAAYLVAAYGWTPDQAITFIKGKRKIAEPNFGFRLQLNEYTDSLRKQQHTSGSPSRRGG